MPWFCSEERDCIRRRYLKPFQYRIRNLLVVLRFCLFKPFRELLKPFGTKALHLFFNPFRLIGLVLFSKLCTGLSKNRNPLIVYKPFSKEVPPVLVSPLKKLVKNLKRFQLFKIAAIAASVAMVGNY